VCDELNAFLKAHRIVNVEKRLASHSTGNADFKITTDGHVKPEVCGHG
jgi:hypothetical protein